MASSVQPIPEEYPRVSPHLNVRDAGRAIEFYKEVFGATEVMRLTDPNGAILHAEIEIGGSLIMLAEEMPDWQNLGPQALGGTPVRIHLYVEDVDAVAARAEEAGAEILIPVDDQFYGDRSGRLEDPFGHVWVIATRKEDLSVEEMQRRMAELFGDGGQ